MGLATRAVGLHLRRVGLAARMLGLQSRSGSGNQNGGSAVCNLKARGGGKGSKKLTKILFSKSI